MKITIAALALVFNAFAVTATEKPTDNADKQAWCRYVHARVLKENPAPGEELIAQCSRSGRGVDYYKCVDRLMDHGDEYSAAGDSCGRKYP